MVNKLLLKNWISVILLISFLISCKKDLITNSSDFIGQLNANKFFEIGTASAEMVNGKIYYDTTLTNPAIAIELNGTPSSDIIITGKIDTSLTEELIDYYKSNDLIADANAFGLIKDTLTIHAGITSVPDSLYGQLISASKLDSSGTYLIPVRLSANNNDNLIKNKVALFRMQFTQNKYYGRFSSGNSYLENNPSKYFPSNMVNNYGFFDITVSRINDHAVGDIIFNVTPGVSSPFKYASLKVKGGLNFDNSIVSNFRTVIDTVDRLTNYAIMPSSNLQVETDEVVVLEDNYSSWDYFVYRMSNLNALSADSNYLFYINLPANTDTNYFPPDPNKAFSNMFVRVKCVDLKSFNVDSNNAVITGTMLDRSNWTVNSSSGNDSVYNANYNPNKPSAAIDGDAYTYWSPSGFSNSSSFYINLSQSHSIKGFRILPNYTDLTMDILTAEILSSNDGVNWTSQGYYFGSATDPNSSVDNPDYKYIHFNNSVEAQYFQIRITSSSNYWGSSSIPEIVGYQ